MKFPKIISYQAIAKQNQGKVNSWQRLLTQIRILLAIVV